MLIFGAGGYAMEIADVYEESSRVPVSGYRVDAAYATTMIPEARNEPVVGFLAIGDPSVRRDVAARFNLWRWGRILSRVAWLSGRASCRSTGLYVAQFASVNAGAVLGEHVHVNVAAIVAHRVVVGDFVQIGPQAQLLGDCVVGSDVEIGAGAIILPKIRVGNGVTVGAGAIVTRDVPDGETIRGEPARVR